MEWKKILKRRDHKGRAKASLSALGIAIIVLVIAMTFIWSCNDVNREAEAAIDQPTVTVTKTIQAPEAQSVPAPILTPTILAGGEQLAIFDVYINIEGGPAGVKNIKFYSSQTGDQTTSASFFLQAGEIITSLPFTCQNEGDIPVDIGLSYTESGDWGTINVTPDSYPDLGPMESFDFTITVAIASDQLTNKLVIVNLSFVDTAG